ncbi:nicotinamide riboside transporter PnuC [Sphingobacterium sp. Mn56C]|uniref:nicotinamide riboside transporter PnuC n=1 Tax=Sphingobacterium sp. Mn56C TaxID=3395261 RepID=UPI003BE4F4B5
MYDILLSLYQHFLQTSILEWVATITGFLCVFLASKQNILNWPISIISVSIYLYIFYQNKLYGDAVLQLYFISTAIYGWYYWSRLEARADKPLSRPVLSLNVVQVVWTLSCIAVLGTLISLLLQKTDTDVPYADGFCTAGSLVAQFLMSRKVLQNWLLWLGVNICYIPLYYHKGLYLTAILYVAFAFIAYQGYKDWRKSYLNFQ